jgi:hypothetical protein
MSCPAKAGHPRPCISIGELLHLVQIARYRLGEIIVARQWDIGIGHAQNDAPAVFANAGA